MRRKLVVRYSNCDDYGNDCFNEVLKVSANRLEVDLLHKNFAYPSAVSWPDTNNMQVLLLN